MTCSRDNSMVDGSFMSTSSTNADNDATPKFDLQMSTLAGRSFAFEISGA